MEQVAGKSVTLPAKLVERNKTKLLIKKKKKLKEIKEIHLN